MNPLAGPTAALRALGLILKSPGLMARAAIPAGVALVASAVGIWAAVHWHAELVDWVWREPKGEGFWAAIVHGVWTGVNWLLGLASGLLSVFITPWLVMLVGLPLCEPLSGAVDAKLGGKAVEGSFFGDLAKTFTTTLGVTAVGVAGAVAFFLLGLIPVLGLVVTPFVTLIWTPMFLAFDLFDSPLARRQLGLRQKVGYVLGRGITALSVGLTATVLVAVPVLNLVGLPVAVAMAVIVVRDREQKAAA
ncbi:MAG: EI24 domain-containing protein [Myxococcales bacterium]|nr:EI24 domain-containing protein [Myxococcales bacterium]